MDTSSYHSNLDSQHLYTEKLFKIIEKLHSICDNASTLPNSEQFILGVEASIQIVEGAIKGNLNQNTSSILHPDQIPLI